MSAARATTIYASSSTPCIVGATLAVALVGPGINGRGDSATGHATGPIKRRPVPGSRYNVRAPAVQICLRYCPGMPVNQCLRVADSVAPAPLEGAEPRCSPLYEYHRGYVLGESQMCRTKSGRAE